MNVENLRKKFLEDVPEGFSKREIEGMSESQLLEMDELFSEDVFGFEETDEAVPFICKGCKCEEEIPKSIVNMLDREDRGDPTCPPRFTCKKCGNLMYPKNYDSPNGRTYTF